MHVLDWHISLQDKYQFQKILCLKIGKHQYPLWVLIYISFMLPVIILVTTTFSLHHLYRRNCSLTAIGRSMQVTDLYNNSIIMCLERISCCCRPRSKRRWGGISGTPGNSVFIISWKRSIQTVNSFLPGLKVMGYTLKSLVWCCLVSSCGTENYGYFVSSWYYNPK